MPRLSSLGPVLLAGVVLTAGAAGAAALTGADAAKDRIDHMKAMGAATKAILDSLKSGKPDMVLIREKAAKIDASARDLPNWFPPGSGQKAYAKSHALPVVWTDRAGFQAKAKDLQTAAAHLNAVAQSGQAAEIGGAFHDVGAACKACHEKFKAKDES